MGGERGERREERGWSSTEESINSDHAREEGKWAERK